MKKRLIRGLFIIGLILVFVGLSFNSKTDVKTKEIFSPQVTPTIFESQEILNEEEVLGEQGKNSEYLVERVIDGDTIKLSNGQTIRYIGIDTPETVDTRKKVQCFGKEASAKNKELVEGKIVRLEKDVSETDRYGRLLRYIYLGDLFINNYLVRQGYAYASSFPPDIKYQSQFNTSQTYARENNLGLWAACQ